MNVADFVLVGASFLAGAQNALAGGGSFLMLAALTAAGLGVRHAGATKKTSSPAS